MGCATGTLKYIHIIANIIFGIIAVVLIICVAGFWAATSVGITVLVIVCILFLITIAGCCGALRESVWLSWVYTICLGIIALGIVIVLFGIVMQINPVEVGHEMVDDEWKLLLKGNSNAMDEMQITDDCCGKDSAEDYVRANITIPQSCYSNEKYHKKSLKLDGCYKTMTNYVIRLKRIFYWICGSLLALELVGAAMGAFLAIHFSNTERRSTY